MYIGDTTARGLHHLVEEVVCNSVDEAVAGFCENINVKINLDGSLTVIDDGRGYSCGHACRDKEVRSGSGYDDVACGRKVRA